MKKRTLLLISMVCLFCILDMNATKAQNSNECIDDCIYPGNTTATHQQQATQLQGVDEVNVEDVLIIGLGYGMTGATRTNASLDFTAQPCEDWAGNLTADSTYSINPKHADCNGDGIIDSVDLVAIRVNYGKQLPHCQYENPVEELAWLNALLFDENGNCRGDYNVFEGTLSSTGKNVFYLSAILEGPEKIHYIYQCDNGTLLCEKGEIDLETGEDPPGCHEQYLQDIGGLENMEFIFSSNCDTPNSCTNNDPLTDLPWLQDLITRHDCCQEYQIYEYKTANNVSLFEVRPSLEPIGNENCNVDIPRTLYNCTGAAICNYLGRSSIGCIAEYTTTEGTLIYQCQPSPTVACHFLDPIQDLDWLNGLLFDEDSLCINFDYDVYQNLTFPTSETVFEFKPISANLPQLFYNCTGELVCSIGNTEEPANCGEEFQALTERVQIFEACPAPPCRVHKPIKELSWLNDLLFDENGICKNEFLQIYQTILPSGEVAFYLTSEPFVSKDFNYLYDCSGNLLCKTGGASDITEPVGCQNMYEIDNNLLENGTLIFDRYCNSFDDCSFSNPLEELSFLKKIVEKADCCNDWKIYQYTTDSIAFFEVIPNYQESEGDNSQCPSNLSTTLYNCSGEIMCIYDLESDSLACPLRAKLHQKTLLYQCGYLESLAECADPSYMAQFDSIDCTDSGEAPVCGCDGVTYEGICAAAKNGIYDVQMGSCDKLWTDYQPRVRGVDVCMTLSDKYEVYYRKSLTFMEFKVLENDKVFLSAENNYGGPATILPEDLSQTFDSPDDYRIIYDAKDPFQQKITGVLDCTDNPCSVNGIFYARQEIDGEVSYRSLFYVKTHSYFLFDIDKIRPILGNISICEHVPKYEGWTREVIINDGWVDICQAIVVTAKDGHLGGRDCCYRLPVGKRIVYDRIEVESYNNECYMGSTYFTAVDTLPQINSARLYPDLDDSVMLPNGNVLYDFSIIMENENYIEPLEDAYGLSFSINFTSSQPMAAGIKLNDEDGNSLSWLGDALSTDPNNKIIYMDTVFYNESGGRIDVGISRINQEALSGSGAICKVACVATIEDWGAGLKTTKKNTEVSFDLTIDNIHLINAKNEVIPTYSRKRSYNKQLNPPVYAELKVILEAAYMPETGKMNTYLSDANLLPIHQPFNQAPWNYDSDFEHLLAVNEIPDDAVDWVLVELRSANEPDKIVEQKAAFLLSDGSIVDKEYKVLGDKKGVRFYTLSFWGTYYIIVRSRNHLDVISREPMRISNYQLSYDFTTSAEQAMGTGQLKALNDTHYALHAGDLDGDGIITVQDFNEYTQLEQSNESYNIADLNCDANISISDVNTYQRNASVIGIPEIRYE